MNNKTQVFTVSLLFIISVLILLMTMVFSDTADYNDLVQDNIASTEISYQDYNFFHVLGNSLRTHFYKFIYDQGVDFVLSTELQQGYMAYSNVSEYDEFLINIYEPQLGIEMNHSMTDLLTELENNNRYIRIFYPYNVYATHDYEQNIISYSDNTLIKQYTLDVSFQGQISDINWQPTPSGSDIPVIISGPAGFLQTYTMNSSVDYNLTISVRSGKIQESIFVDFDNTDDQETFINYSSVDDSASTCEREAGTSSSTGRYNIEIQDGGRHIKYDGIGQLLSGDDNHYCEKDTFTITVSNATTNVNVTTKASTLIDSNMMSMGEVYDFLGYKIEFVDVSSGVYTFIITSVCDSYSLNTIEFDFGEGSIVTSPIDGSNVDLPRTECELIDYITYDVIDLDITTRFDLDGNLYKITSNYPNTMANFSFSNYFVSRGFE